MTVLDRIRIERAVLTYDFWLDLRGTPGRRRRDLRRELRTNLREAATRGRGREAVAALGSTRQMAADAGVDDRARPRWGVGAWAGAAAFAVCVNLGFFAAIAWFDGARAADPAGTVTGSITFFPGSTLRYAPEGDGFSMAFTLSWLPFAAALLVFVLVARPWRLVTGRGTAARTAAQTST